MLAPGTVLHLPDPADLAAGIFGAERAAELLREADAVPRDQVIAEVLAAPPPTTSVAAATNAG
jgi:hypothetical protein